MDYESVKVRICKVLDEVGIGYDLDNESDISDALQDSLQFISLIVALEDEFNIEIPDEIMKMDLLQSMEQLCSEIYMLVCQQSV